MSACCSCPHEYAPVHGCRCVCHTPDGESPYIVWFHLDGIQDSADDEDINPVRGAAGSGTVSSDDEAIAAVRTALAAHWGVPDDNLTFLQITRDPDDLTGLVPGGLHGVWV